MVVLLLCVLEVCLGGELCGSFCCQHGRAHDAEGRGGSNDPPTPQPSEAPPSYDVIMAQGTAEAHTGAAGGRESESLPLKRGFSFNFKPPAPDDDRLPPMRPLSSPDVSETSFASPGELWLAVDGLPTYEEAVARLREEEEEEVATIQEGEAGALNQREAEAMQQEEGTAYWIPEEQGAEQLREQAPAGLREEGSS